MKSDSQQPPSDERKPHIVRSAEGAGRGRIEWTSSRVRSDIAADPDAWLSTEGFVGSVPVVTAESFRRYVETWMMVPGTVIEADGALIHDSYSERFVFPVVGMVDGAPVYTIDGYGHFER